LLRLNPFEVTKDVIVRYRQPAYCNYINFLPSYMAATFTKSRMPLVNPFNPVTYKIDRLLPIKLPALATNFSGPIPPAIKNSLIEKGYTEATVKGQRVLIFETVDNVLIELLRNNGANPISVCPGNSINISTIPVIVTVRRILSAFLQTHSYPAFRDENQLNDVTGLEAGSAKGKRKVVSGDFAVEDAPPARKRGPGASESVDDDVVMEETPASDLISVALPQTIKHGWKEDEDDLVTTGGLFFHYIPDLAHPDHRTLPSVMSQHFIGCFGSNKNEALEQIKVLRERWGNVSDTELGKELTHLCAVIDIGLRAQARIIPIYSAGVYNGAILSGVGYTIAINRKVYEPLDMTALGADLNRHSGNAGYLEAIANCCGATGEDRDTVTDSRTFWELKDAVEGMNITENDRDEIVKLAQKLNFKRHWALNDTIIVNALRLAASTDDIKDVPIHPSVLFSSDRLTLVWSGFGFNAPSCNFIGGPVVDLRKSKSASGSISWKTVPLPQALADLQQIVSEKKFCKATGGRRSGPFKDRTFDGKKAKDVWEALVTFSGASAVGAVAGGEGIDHADPVGASGVFTSYEI
jgi:hypothetical protein